MLARKTAVWSLVSVIVLVSLVTALGGAAAADHPLKGQKIDMAILGIGGWLPSRLGVDMSPLFAEYAKEKFGYDVSFTFAEAPFSALFQKAASTLATRSQEYNIIISDSQWLGAFAEPGWIVNVSDLIAEHPELDIEWYDQVVVDTYMEYPEGSGDYWGLPEEGDTIALFVRTDLFGDPEEQAAFKEKYGWDLPQTFEDWEEISMTEFEQIAEFFTRPEYGLYGTAMQYSKEYDFMTMYLYPFMFSMGGDIWDPQKGEVYGILNSEVNAKAMVWNKRMLSYQPPGAINYGIAEEIDAFTQDKVATAFQWAAVGLAMITDENKDRVMVVPPPGFEQEDGSLKRLYSIGGQPWVINAFNDEAHMTVAIDFLKWWYLPETQLEFARRGGNPCVKAVLETEGFEDIQPWFRAFKYMLRSDRSRDFWHDPKYSEMLAAQQEGFTAFATGQIDDPALGLEYAACEQQKILYEAGRSEIAPPDSCKDVRLR
ncbi:extracellular solute-binding protein [candidate division KSB3 bacterium]|uniref:Extracellular solute-binding protein n=1 Tax=candidate division KSB3 bacterium TaxID=2044937 RepID=A0A9D5JVQ2_9BACT|nr:extracellular solute-binding protein [candidate division KSB3 bacterium]MBD3324801.1 extracellular solute-binding protein [candidate division KSB3 bacterium]